MNLAEAPPNLSRSPWVGACRFDSSRGSTNPHMHASMPSAYIRASIFQV